MRASEYIADKFSLMIMDVRFLADIKLFREDLDKTQLDNHIGVCSLLVCLNENLDI